MAHGWNPLEKYSSLPPNRGTPVSEMNHSYPAGGYTGQDGYAGHDGFASASTPLGVSATNTSYCFSSNVVNVNSNWCPEIGNYQKPTQEMEWQPDFFVDKKTSEGGSPAIKAIKIEEACAAQKTLASDNTGGNYDAVNEDHKIIAMFDSKVSEVDNLNLEAEKEIWTESKVKCEDQSNKPSNDEQNDIFKKCRKQVADSDDPVEEDVPLRANIEMVLADSPAEDSPEEDMEDSEPQTKSSVEKKTVVYQCSECDQSFTDGLMLISHLEDHGREEQEKRLNKCSKCGKIFSTQGRLEKHMKVHESGMFVCNECSTEVPSKADLELHKKQCHDPSYFYSCRLCKHRFKTKASLCDHCTKEHPNDIFSCSLCDRNYTLKASLVRHMNRSHGQEQKDETVKSLSTQSTSESECDDNDNDNDNDNDDDNNDNNDDSDSNDSDSAPYFPCHVCGKTFTTSQSLEDHQRCHLGEKPFECAECGQCFFQAAQLQQHERKHNSEFQCRVCGRGFVSLFALRKHKHTSGKKRPFRCKKCDLFFTSPAQLAEHKISIHKEENFPCDICNRAFPSKSSRAEHRKIHLPKTSGIGVSDKTAVVAEKKPASLPLSPANEFKYRCGVCCERFRNPEELSEHGCLAGAERQYSCMDCDKHFLHSSHLKKHLSTHKQSSLSKYLCNHCNNSFSSSHDFLNHLRNHDETLRYGQQGFLCPVCHQCFASPAELVFHFPTHPSEAFECKICNKTFLTASKLKEHEVCHTNDTNSKKCGQSCSGTNHDCSQKHLDSSFGDDDEIDVTGRNCWLRGFIADPAAEVDHLRSIAFDDLIYSPCEL
ncbi:hypothetical protein WMY93_008598 [Mugilogobius chulae]|uniref:C2H2-type domain-containing protein n=1 Tax=Mugilogobius chulae TaxID=88201 RepID=A0AAW0PJJ1_9GOBI